MCADSSSMSTSLRGRSSRGDAATARRTTWQADLDGFHRSAGVALLALRMACEPKVEKAVAHSVATLLADNGRPVVDAPQQHGPGYGRRCHGNRHLPRERGRKT